MHKDSDTLTETPASTKRTVEAGCCDCGKTFEAVEVFAFDMWLRAVHRCDSCHALAIAEHERSEAAAARLARVRLWNDEVGRDAFTDTNPDLLPNRHSYDKAMAWKFGPAGLILHGKSGRGKSRILWEILRHLFVEEGRHVHFARATAFARAVTNAGMHEHGLEAYLRQVSRVGVLALDDLGTESVSEKWEASLLEVIDRRINAKLPTLITTNYVGEVLVSRFKNPATGEAIVRRLRESCVGVHA